MRGQRSTNRLTLKLVTGAFKMIQITRPIIAKQTLSPTLWQVTLGLEADDTFVQNLAPGQYFLAQCGDSLTAYLRRPIFPAYVGERTLQFLLATADLTDPGLAWFISRRVGETIDLLGPCGRGFSLKAESLLLIGSGMHIGPLLFALDQAVQRGSDTILALEALRGTDLFPTHYLPAATEVHLATLDGKVGHRGAILDVLDDALRWTDGICAIGPLDFYRRLKSRLEQTRLHLVAGLGEILLTPPALRTCGSGICTLCIVPTTRGLKLACQDGPFFDLTSLPHEVTA